MILIYIPLWHLLIPSPRRKAGVLPQIYIPLWHVLIFFHSNLHLNLNDHLHSTMASINQSKPELDSDDTGDLHSTMASINQISNIKPVFLMLHLHSTMASINQCCIDLRCKLPDHLHSTMASINRCWTISASHGRMKFTFHYGIY